MLGVMLAPLVIALQFYLIRLVGVPFEQTTLLLIALNLPSAYLLSKQVRSGHWHALRQVDRSALAIGGFLLFVILVCIAPFLLDPQKRLYTWEAWTQADVIYAIANGGLDLQDAELAGVRLSYPWVGHVYQAVLSYTVGTPPVTNYIWPNLIWLLCIFGFGASIVAELGGNSLSQVSNAIWLSFGVNFVGSALGSVIPADWVKAHPLLGGIWGDNRYTPWLDKVVFFGQMYFAMGIFAALMFLLIKRWPVGVKSSYLCVVALLLIGLALIYPVLLPPACVAMGAKALIVLWEHHQRWSLRSLPEVMGLAVSLITVTALSLGYIKFLTEGRTGNSLINLHDLAFVRQRMIETLIVMSPLLCGLGVVLAGWAGKRKHAILFILGSSALASCLIYVLFDIPWWRNEYKFIFSAAIILAPFPSLALEPLLVRFGRMALPALMVLILVLAAPFAGQIYLHESAYTKGGPLVNVQRFDLRLDASEPYSGLVDAIRERTSLDSLLVVEDADIYFPTLTRRQLYVAPANQEPHPGILITSDEMLTQVKGYPPQILSERRSTVSELFDSNDLLQMQAALRQIQGFNRPLALIADRQRQAALLHWLSTSGSGRAIYEADQIILWYIEPTNSALDER